MKRIFVTTILGVGLLAMAGALADQHKKLAADGNPPPPFPWYVADGNPPPPFPPHPPSIKTLVADGNPPPPFPPYPHLSGVAQDSKQLIADGNPPPPFPPTPKPPALA
jgi:hypothetical protein